MKHLKKLGSVLLALVMVMALAAPAFASGDGNANVKLTLDENSGHMFDLYQLFTGTPKDGASLDLDTIQWGPHVDKTKLGDLWEALAEAFPGVFNDGNGKNNIVAGDGAKYLANLLGGFDAGSKTATVDDTAKLVKTILDINLFGGINSGNLNSTKTEETVSPGYYLIVDKLSSNDTDPAYMAWVIGKYPEADNVLSITPKKGDTGVKKEVLDPTTVEGEGEQWKDGAIYNTEDGKSIKFKITLSLPEDLLSDKYKNGTSYNLYLRDYQDNGLAFDKIESVRLMAGATKVMDLTYNTLTGKDLIKGDKTASFGIMIPSLQNVTNIDPNKHHVEVIYTAQYSKDAVVGPDGNNNNVKVWVNDEGTPVEDNTKVYKLELVVEKTDADGKPLEGAAFALVSEEYLTIENNEPKVGADGKVELKDKSEVNGGTWIDLVERLEKDKDGKVTGVYHTTSGELKAGDYTLWLVETTVPTGYNAAKAIKVHIKAEVEPAGDTSTTPGELKLTIDEPFKIVEKITTVTTKTTSGEGGAAETETTSYKISGKVMDTSVKNLKGSLLPETGGIGTTIFYIVGGVLVVGAVVLLITKRRTSVDDE